MSRVLLDVQKITKVFGSSFLSSKNRVVALNSVDLRIPEKPATIIAVAGESGSGKTTLAKLILGFMKPTAGQILYASQVELYSSFICNLASLTASPIVFPSIKDS